MTREHSANNSMDTNTEPTTADQGAAVLVGSGPLLGVSGRPKLVYCLRVRMDDSAPWSDPEYYRTRRERDRVAATNRILGGIRTHSFEERKTPAELAELFA